MKMMVLVFLAACSLWGQVGKKHLQESDYGLWSTLTVAQYSTDGAWLSYHLSYAEGQDTLFVRSIAQKKEYSIAQGYDGNFVGSTFICRNTKGDLHILDLLEGTKITYTNVQSYAIGNRGSIVGVQRDMETTIGSLLVIGLEGTLRHRVDGVNTYSLSPAQDVVVYEQAGQLLFLTLDDLQHGVPITTIPQTGYAIAWQPSGCVMAYVAGGTVVGSFDFSTQQHRVGTPTLLPQFPTGGQLCDLSVTPLSVSADGTRIFFGVREALEPEAPASVEVWSTSDPLLYPREQAIQQWRIRPKLAVWSPKTDHYAWVTDSSYPYAIVSPDSHYALVYNPIANEPQWDYEAPVDYYLKDLATGAMTLFLKEHSPESSLISFSPTGAYIAYFKEGDWWLYTLSEGTHRNLTQGTGGCFTELFYDRSGSKKVCGLAGWGQGDTALLVYDTYDLWILDIDGTGARRITNGYTSGCVYRIAAPGVSTRVLDLSRPLYLKGVAATQSGYFQWEYTRGLRPLVWGMYRLSAFQPLQSGGFVYVREHFHHPPEIVYSSPKGSTRQLVQSNPQHWRYAWGFSKVITYPSEDGTLLRGALYYPAGYQPERRYPMVVHIYERQSDLHAQYVNPTLYNQDGFNTSNLTQQGYFVLLPDIRYTEGMPGRSALYCVQKAIEEVVAHESVDQHCIGLAGHSFGGFETNYILTQTPRFAAAISGAGVSDVVSSYFTVGRASKKMDSWRYEWNQFRMGFPFYSDVSRYLINSPLLYASAIHTPLLLWAGKEDASVEYRQSLMLHLALRRLQRNSTFLLYTHESHALLQPMNQVDLTHRMEAWWRTYLQ